jgi:hypothetical protein
MHADPKAHASIFGHAGQGIVQRALNRERSRHGASRRLEDRKDRVPCHVDHASVVRFDMRTKYRSRGVQGNDGGGFISRHQARVADHVGGQNRCEPLSEFVSAQPSSSTLRNTSPNLTPRRPKYPQLSPFGRNR